MKTTKSLAIALALTFAASAQANALEMVAGWDFSQYFGPNFLTTDGATLATTLSANYSDLDPTSGLGTESAAFGTMYIDGSNGSHTTTGGPSDPFVPTGGNLASNAGKPGVAPPFGSGAACNLLGATGEGSQSFCNDLSMISNGTSSPVFVADLTSISFLGNDWELSFGGKTFSGTSSLLVEISTDGTSYAAVGSPLGLTTVDSQYTVSLGASLNGASQIFVRLGLDAAAGAPIVDNLALSATTAAIPEPGTAALALVGLLGLGVFGRRRS
jgi:hypothetical protein